MKYLIQGATVVNEGIKEKLDVLIDGEFIAKIGTDLVDADATIIKGKGKLLVPGMIDDQVHFREPGLTHKGEIHTEAKAAVAGGITTYMEMPNTVPQALTQELLEDKYQRAAEVSLANYSFFMGAANHNMEEVLKTDPKTVCGVKIFMGSSTGDMLVDDREVLEGIFSKCSMLIATHCEDEATIRKNLANAKDEFGEEVPIKNHPLIRSAEACYKSSSLAVELAKKYNTRLHILHISTAKELDLFDSETPLAEKRITAEACIHHMWFTDKDYKEKGTYIKWNPAVKTKADRDAIVAGVKSNKIDIIATDHAPHTMEEKNNTYFNAPSGGPLVQHAMVALLQMVKEGKFTIEEVVNKTSHAVAECFQIEKRGYIREGYYADLVLIDPKRAWKVAKVNVLYKCGWSPFEGQTFSNSIEKTFVSGHLAFDSGSFDETKQGQRITFDRG